METQNPIEPILLPASEVSLEPVIDGITDTLLKIEKLMEGVISKYFLMEMIDAAEINLLNVEWRIPYPTDNRYFCRILVVAIRGVNINHKKRY